MASMKNLFLLTILFTISCARTPIIIRDLNIADYFKVKLSGNFNTSFDMNLTEELIYINGISNTEFRNELIALFREIKELDIHKGNCSTGQLACSFKNRPGIIYLTENFFKLSLTEQVSTILHEAKHIQSADYNHVKCVKYPSWGHECDENLNSSYGIEYKYLLYKYIETKNDEIAQVLKRINFRLNNI